MKFIEVSLENNQRVYLNLAIVKYIAPHATNQETTHIRFLDDSSINVIENYQEVQAKINE